LLLFFIVCSRALRHLPSFPTRRSSDLASARLPQPGGLSSPVAKGARTSKLRSGNWVPIYGCCLLKTPKAWVNSTFPTRALQGKSTRFFIFCRGVENSEFRSDRKLISALRFPYFASARERRFGVPTLPPVRLSHLRRTRWLPAGN